MVVQTARPGAFTHHVVRAFANLSDEVVERVVAKLTEEGIALNDATAEQVESCMRAVFKELADARWDQVMGPCPSRTVAYESDLFSAGDFDELEQSGKGRHTRPIRRIPNR